MATEKQRAATRNNVNDTCAGSEQDDSEDRLSLVR